MAYISSFEGFKKCLRAHKIPQFCDKDQISYERIFYNLKNSRDLKLIMFYFVIKINFLKN